MIHYVRQWMADGKVPQVPIYMDSALAADIAEVHEQYPECMDLTSGAGRVASGENKEPVERRGARGLAPRPSPLASQIPVRYIRASDESKALSQRRESCVLVASGGMCEAGRILNHLENNLDDPRNSVVLVSYQVPGSLGASSWNAGPWFISGAGAGTNGRTWWTSTAFRATLIKTTW